MASIVTQPGGMPSTTASQLQRPQSFDTLGETIAESPAGVIGQGAYDLAQGAARLPKIVYDQAAGAVQGLAQTELPGLDPFGAGDVGRRLMGQPDRPKGPTFGDAMRKIGLRPDLASDVSGLDPNVSPPESIAGQLGQGVASVIPAFAGAALTGGGTIPMTLMAAAQSYGSAFRGAWERAQQMGANEEQANQIADAQAVAAGVTTALTQGWVGKALQGIRPQTLERAVQRAVNGGQAESLLKVAIKEGGQEGIEELNAILSQYVAEDDPTALQNAPGRLAMAVGAGTLGGGVIAGVQAVGSQQGRRQAPQDYPAQRGALASFSPQNAQQFAQPVPRGEQAGPEASVEAVEQGAPPAAQWPDDLRRESGGQPARQSQATSTTQTSPDVGLGLERSASSNTMGDLQRPESGQQIPTERTQQSASPQKQADVPSSLSSLTLAELRSLDLDRGGTGKGTKAGILKRLQSVQPPESGRPQTVPQGPETARPAQTPAQSSEVQTPPVSPESQTASPTPSQSAGSVREPWEMTKADFAGAVETDKDLARSGILLVDPSGNYIKKEKKGVTVWRAGNTHSALAGTFALSDSAQNMGMAKERLAKLSAESHREVIGRALRDKKPVPPEVLADYPDLQPKAAAKATAETTPKWGVYPTEVAGRGTMFAVRESDNPKGFGDTIHPTREAAEKFAAEAKDRDERNAKSRKEAADLAAAKAASEAAKKAEREDVGGFADNLPPLRKGKVLKDLDAMVRVGGVADTTRNHVKRMVADGAELSERQEPKVKPPTRTAWNRMDQRQQDAHEKRAKEAGNVSVYRIGGYNLGKTAYDYAKFLKANPPATKANSNPSPPFESKPPETIKVAPGVERAGSPPDGVEAPAGVAKSLADLKARFPAVTFTMSKGTLIPSALKGQALADWKNTAAGMPRKEQIGRLGALLEKPASTPKPDTTVPPPKSAKQASEETPAKPSETTDGSSAPPSSGEGRPEPAAMSRAQLEAELKAADVEIEGPHTDEQLRSAVAELREMDKLGDLLKPGDENTSMGAAPDPRMEIGPDGKLRKKMRSASDLVIENLAEDTDFAFSDEKSEQRWKVATRGLQKIPTIMKIQGVINEIRKYTHGGSLPELPRTKQFGEARAQIQRLTGARAVAADRAVQVLDRTIKHLKPKEYDLFSRKVVMDDLVETEGALPFGFTPETARAELDRLNETISSNPKIAAAVEYRRRMWDAIKSDYISNMAKFGVDVSERLKRENYFRHQVMFHMERQQLERATGTRTPTGQPEISTARGFLKGRKGSEMDINANYVQAEFEVMAQMIADTQVAKALAELKRPLGTYTGDIYPKVAEALREGGGTLEEYIPDTHKPYYVRPGRSMFSVMTIPEQMAYEALEANADVLGVPVGDIRKRLALGSEYKPMILPREVTDQLEALPEYAKPTNRVDQVVKGITRGWKVWQLHGPHRVLKYNIRNASEVEKVATVNPSALKRIPEATRDLWKLYKGADDAPANVREWSERGGAGLVRINELELVPDIERLAKTIQAGADPLTAKNAAGKGWRKYWDTVGKASDFRESVLRYAMYLDYKAQLEQGKGKPKNYGASNRAEVDGIRTVADKAYRLSADVMGDYADVSRFGQMMRQRWDPFWSFKETNFRTYLGAIKNMANDGKSAGEIAKAFAPTGVRMTGQVAMKFGKIAALLAGARLVTQAWNHLMFPDEEKKLSPEDQRSVHLVLGSDSDGNPIHFNRLGTSQDFLSWFGSDALDADLMDLLNNKRTLSEVATSMAQKPVKKMAGSAGPAITIPYGLVTGKSVYPDPLNPRKINSDNDRVEFLFQQVGMEEAYRRMMGKPVAPRSIVDRAAGMATYTADVGRTAYYRILDERDRFKDRQGMPVGGSSEGARTTALRNAKLSIRYSDTDMAARYLRQYFTLGGTSQGLEQSMKAMHPLHGIPKDKQEAFKRGLTTDDRRALDDAIEYYEKVLRGQPGELDSAISKAGGSPSSGKAPKKRPSFSDR